MGFFCSEVQNVVVSQVANGKSTAEITVEILLLCIIIYIVLTIISKIFINGFKKYINLEFQRARALDQTV